VSGEEEDRSPLSKLRWADPNHDRYKRSKKHEERIAKELGGRRLPNSGGKQASKYAKVGRVSNVSFRGEKHSEGFTNVTLDGDIGQRRLHVEHKRTVKDSIGFKKEWWIKVADGAQSTDTIPALVFTFESGRLGVDDLDLAVVPFALLKRWAAGKT
jgi:hypothetical protein